MNEPKIDGAIRGAPATPVQPLPVATARQLPDAVLKGIAVQGAGEAQPVPPESMQRAAARMEDYARSVGRSLQFRVDHDSGKVVVSVRDPSTGELIRQIPSESALKIAEQLDSSSATATSLIFDQRA